MESIYRPFVGIIAEGKCEYHTYPSLISKIINCESGDIPIVYAGGWTEILKYLPEQLDSLLLSHNPYTVITTVDLKDVIESGYCNSCGEVVDLIYQQYQDWLDRSQGRERLHPLPKYFSVVVQIQKLESWWAADPHSLSQLPYINIQNPPTWSNVDHDLPNPEVWLQERIDDSKSLKHPSTSKTICSAVEYSVLKQNSGSFDKFSREISTSQDVWLDELIG